VAVVIIIIIIIIIIIMANTLSPSATIWSIVVRESVDISQRTDQNIA
jgi:hypothetical protein